MYATFLVLRLAATILASGYKCLVGIQILAGAYVNKININPNLTEFGGMADVSLEYAQT